VNLKQLSRQAGIPFGKVYSVIAALRQKGLVAETPGRPKQVHVPDAQAVLARLIEQRQRQDDALYAELRALGSELATAQSRPSRFLQLGTTVAENRELQLRAFTEAEREVCQVLNVHHKPKSNRASKTPWEREIGNAIRRGVAFRAIYPCSVTLPPLLARLPEDRFQVRRLDTGFTRCDIIDGRKVLLKLVHPDPLAFGGAVFIEDGKFARNLQGVFETFWEQAATRP
jgi:sugar-specific transcriptional regulator TrmB